MSRSNSKPVPRHPSRADRRKGDVPVDLKRGGNEAEVRRLLERGFEILPIRLPTEHAESDQGVVVARVVGRDRVAGGVEVAAVHRGTATGEHVQHVGVFRPLAGGIPAVELEQRSGKVVGIEEHVVGDPTGTVELHHREDFQIEAVGLMEHPAEQDEALPAYRDQLVRQRHESDGRERLDEGDGLLPPDTPAGADAGTPVVVDDVVREPRSGTTTSRGPGTLPRSPAARG